MEIDFLFVIFIAWDIFYVNKKHLLAVEIIYPFVILIIVVVIFLLITLKERSRQAIPKEGNFLKSNRSLNTSRILLRNGARYFISFIIIIIGLYYLQSYRDNTRYKYYRNHSDIPSIPRTFVDGWEFIDRPDEKRSVALTMGWNAPGHKWFFYPLLGRWLQNDIVYVSAKYKWETPTWLDQGKLRGDDLSIWLFNLERKKVDYIFVAKPWPMEIEWMSRNKDKFNLVFSDREYSVFKYQKPS
jgi:hypothetical protein